MVADRDISLKVRVMHGYKVMWIDILTFLVAFWLWRRDRTHQNGGYYNNMQSTDQVLYRCTQVFTIGATIETSTLDDQQLYKLTYVTNLNSYILLADGNFSSCIYLLVLHIWIHSCTFSADGKISSYIHLPILHIWTHSYTLLAYGKFSSCIYTYQSRRELFLTSLDIHRRNFCLCQYTCHHSDMAQRSIGHQHLKEGKLIKAKNLLIAYEHN
jgi:hypothetical protein